MLFRSDRIRPQNRPNLEPVAAEFGVSEAELREAMGKPERNGEQARGQRRPRLDITGAASQLGVTEAELIAALGIPAERLDDRPVN